MINEREQNRMETFAYKSVVPIAPGESVLEILNERGLKQSELAKRMGRPLKLINEIIKGKATITADTAIQLEQVLGVPAHFWNNLESNYQEVKARLKAEKKLKLESSMARHYPYKQMADFGWVPQATDIVERTKNLGIFFGVSSLKSTIEEDKLVTAHYRISNKSSYSVYAVAAWLRKGFLESQIIDTKPFDVKKLRESLMEIRSQTKETPEVFYPKIQNMLANCGIAFVVTRTLKKAPINGASQWVSQDKALIQLSLRYHFSDIFWFSLLHEIGHILLHGKKTFNISIDRINNNDEKEQEADCFASDLLIPKSSFQKFASSSKFDECAVKQFASEQGLHSGIVVGRLQHEKLISYKDLHHLRNRFIW